MPELLSKKRGICVSQPLVLALAPGPNLYLTNLAPNLHFTAPALNLYLPAPALTLCLPWRCLPALRLTVKVCYSYSVYLYNLTVYLNVLTS